METIDIVVVALNRACFKALVVSIEKHLQHSGYKLRLVLHVDYIGCYNTYDIEKDISNLTKYFINSEIKIEATNVGHTESFLWCIQQVQNNCIYIEDDKVFIKDVDINDIINCKEDIVSLEGNSGAKGNTSANYFSKESIEFLLKHYPPRNKWSATERINKIVFSENKNNFTYNRLEFECIADMGYKSLAKNGLIRRRSGRRQSTPIYIPTPKHIGYLINIRRQEICHYNMSIKKWLFYFCIESFPIQYMQDNRVDNFFTFTTEYTGIVNSSLRPYAKCTYALDYEDIKNYDVYGNSKIWFIKSKLLEVYIKTIWDIERIHTLAFEHEELKIKRLTPQSMGFNLREI